MKMKEIFTSIKNFFLNLDNAPEHIAAFPAHTLDCTKSGPLQKTVNFIGPIPSWSNLGLGTEISEIIIECLECGGKTVEKR